ncbi:hypothetical protein LUZ63_005102 [Rhynchospora breviuscula]|uniref:Cytochrome P450 n=1 Tax=Rhynchospora breviuscula TaxID=2022672 RepID=A0A9Q0CMR2_9POAL|nr:hypothetical protein LUZ63_005102 [Rhynchospora breviuscula]
MRDLSRRYGPLMFLQLGEIPTVVVSSPDAAKEIMKTHDITFASRPISTTLQVLTDHGKGAIFPPYGDYWRQVRKICILELLSHKRVQSFTSIRKEEVSNLIQSIESAALQDQLVNLTERLAVMVNDITARTVIGGKSNVQDSYLDAVRKVSELGAGFNLVDMLPSSRLVRLLSSAVAKAKIYKNNMSCTLDDVIRQHREKKAQRDGEVEDLLDVLLRIHEGGTMQVPLDIENIKAVITDIFGAGTDTSSTVLEWAMAELMRNPRVMEKAQVEVRQHFKGCTGANEMDLAKLNYMHLVIKETLRLHPPAPVIARKQIQQPTCVVSGYDIPQGTNVLVNAWAIARDPKYWEEPEEFKPERFIKKNVDFKGMDFEFIPFGAGRRICPGMTFGLATVELTLARLLYHFDWKLPDGEEIDMSESFGIVMNKRSPLLLHAVPNKTTIIGET